MSLWLNIHYDEHLKIIATTAAAIFILLELIMRIL
jgi:hypothetical protein